MSGKELFEGMSYVDERYVDEADCVILDLSSEATKPFCWNAYRIQGRSRLHNKRKVAIILLAAALMLVLVSCGVAAVIHGDSIQEWFSHYWEQITGQEMEADQTAVIRELSQKIGVSATDGNLTITVDSATGSENIFYFLVRVEGHPFTQKHRYSFASRRLTVAEEALPDNLRVSSFGIQYLGVAEDGAGLFLIHYDYATSDGDIGDIKAVPMTLYLENMTRRNPHRDHKTAKIVEEGKWSISFTLDRSQLSEKVQLPDTEVCGMDYETGERVSITLSNIVLSNTGIRFTYDSKGGTVEPYSGFLVLLKNGARIEDGQGAGTVEDDLTTLNYDWHWSIPLNLDDIASISIGGTEILINLESN